MGLNKRTVTCFHNWYTEYFYCSKNPPFSTYSFHPHFFVFSRFSTMQNCNFQWETNVYTKIMLNWSKKLWKPRGWIRFSGLLTWSTQERTWKLCKIWAKSRNGNIIPAGLCWTQQSQVSPDSNRWRQRFCLSVGQERKCVNRQGTNWRQPVFKTSYHMLPEEPNKERKKARVSPWWLLPDSWEEFWRQSHASGLSQPKGIQLDFHVFTPKGYWSTRWVNPF